MQIYTLALVSSEWGVARFLTDSIALIALGILIGLPLLLLRDQLGIKSVWSDDNAFSDR